MLWKLVSKIFSDFIMHAMRNHTIGNRVSQGIAILEEKQES